MIWIPSDKEKKRKEEIKPQYVCFCQTLILSFHIELKRCDDERKYNDTEESAIYHIRD